MKNTVFLTVGLVLLATVTATAAPTAPADAGPRELPASVLFAKLSPSVVTIDAKLANGTAQGSGVVVGKGLVVTNYHVVRDNTGLKVKNNGRVFAATLHAFDIKRDLAILEVAELSAPRVAFRASADIKVGEHVLAIGAPRGLDLTLSDGLISAKRPDQKGGKDTGVFLLQTSAPISPGSSGGGLFDQRGRLIGVTTFFLSNGQNLNFAHPTEWITELLGGTKGEGSAGKDAPRDAAKYGLTTRPEALRCTLHNTTTWGMFSSGPELLENRPVSGVWDFDAIGTQTPRALAVPRFTMHDEMLVLSDINRDASYVRFSPQREDLRAEYFFFFDADSFRMAVMQPIDFHGQTRAQVTFGACEELTSQVMTQRRGEQLVNPYPGYSPYSPYTSTR